MKTKKTTKILAVICCVTLLFSMAGCTTSPEDTSDDISENESTVDETDSDVIANFIGSLDYVNEKEDGSVECSMLIEALEGSFKTEVEPKDISFDGDFAEATNVQIISNDGSIMEVDFVLPKGEFDADNFSAEATVKLADGVLLDNEGKAVGEMAETSVYTLDESDRAVSSSEPIDCTLTLRHTGAYVAEFYVYWDEVVGVNADGSYIIVTRSWEENGQNKTAGFKSEIFLENVVNVRVIAKMNTGLVWDPWRKIVEIRGLHNEMYVKVSGTTLNPNYEFEVN